MTIMFQYKGKAYAFCALDEVLIDIDKAIEGIEAGRCPEMPMTPEEVTAYLRDRKKNPQNYAHLPENGEPN
jgi:hypothetical protein